MFDHTKYCERGQIAIFFMVFFTVLLLIHVALHCCSICFHVFLAWYGFTILSVFQKVLLFPQGGAFTQSLGLFLLHESAGLALHYLQISEENTANT